METVDVAVIGAGVLGCALARELARYRADVLVLERARDVGEGSSKANSGVVHAGFHPRGGSLKGRSCVVGNELFPRMAEELHLPFVRCGALMAAFSAGGVDKLCEKAARGAANGARELAIVDGEEARSLEPRLSTRAIAALVAPSTGIVSPFELVLALAQNASRNGVDFRFNAEVERIEGAGGAAGGVARLPAGCRYLLHLADGSRVAARLVANMAGDRAMQLDAQVHPADLVVRPRLGEYLVFDKQDPSRAITRVLYQAADSDEGGTLLAPTVDGNLLAGPTSRDVRGFRAPASTAEGLDHIWRVAEKLVPDLRWDDVIANFAGVRANIVNVDKQLKDFVVRASAPGFVSALGIKNPGLTCSPALAAKVLDELAREGLKLECNRSFDPNRPPRPPFLKRSASEQARLLAADPSFGRVICRCEQVTEGDVRAALREPLPPSTMSGLKHRLRVGMGRCQGAFCLPRAVAAMALEQGMSEQALPFGELGGRFVARRVK